MKDTEVHMGKEGCKRCNICNTQLIVPLHQMNEKDFKKLGIDYWGSDFSNIFSNGT